MLQHIISASRRTDIPAFYSGWFLNRLREQYALVLQPYSRQWRRVSLAPGDIGAIVFWSKNFEPLLPKLETIEKTTRNLFFHFTITANRDLELRTPDFRDAARDFLFIANRYSADHIIWRFDPLCITDKLSWEVTLERFIACAELLKGRARTCTISFAHPYRKVLFNMQKYTDHTFIDLPAEEKKACADRLAAHAERCRIRLAACCNDRLISGRVGKASCIDGRGLSLLFGAALDTTPAATRKECACTLSIDIGAYDTCGHGCIYCYANTDQDKASRAPASIDPDGPALAPRGMPSLAP